MKSFPIVLAIVVIASVSSLLIKSCTQVYSEVGASVKSTQVVLDYSDKEFRSMTIPQALILKENFMKNHVPMIKSRLNVQPTEAIYYSLEDLKNLVWYIEYHAKSAKRDIKPEELGVNIHFGQYPSQDGLSAFPQLTPQELKTNANKQTIFFVPTITVEGKTFEFNPKKNHMEMMNKKSNRIKSLSEHHKQDIETYKLIDYEEDSPIPNFGKHRPPYGNTDN